MPDISQRSSDAGRRLHDQYATDSLPPSLARVFGQHVRLRAGQAPLPSWRPREFEDAFAQAIQLIEYGTSTTSSATEDEYTRALRRAAEILEWLSYEELNDGGLPLGLLGAACYQLAGYPARARTLATRQAPDEQDAPLIRGLVSGDYAQLLVRAIRTASRGRERVDGGTPSIQIAVVAEFASAVATIVTYLRSGDADRLDRAVDKLDDVILAFRHVGDPLSWACATLGARSLKAALSSSLRKTLPGLVASVNQDGQDAFERYARLAFLEGRSVAWPSQIKGINALVERDSFALCTPTGSGKTTIAELGLLQGLFRQPVDEIDEMLSEIVEPLCLYLVPSRALAAEVEAKLHRVLRRSTNSQRIEVTSLYGGAIGAADLWLNNDQPTVLICTPEKAEALIRVDEGLLGRLRLVIVDEAHSVENDNKDATLIAAESRPLRVESLVSRLRARPTGRRIRYIAMSAVATAIQDPLSRWIAGSSEQPATFSDYRSTRQLVGRLRCESGRRSRIEYDFLDGHRLRVTGRADDSPFVPQPYPRHPPTSGLEGPLKGAAPYALWAAIHATARNNSAALISVAYQVDNYATWFADLLENQWSLDELPVGMTA